MYIAKRIYISVEIIIPYSHSESTSMTRAIYISVEIIIPYSHGWAIAAVVVSTFQ